MVIQVQSSASPMHGVVPIPPWTSMKVCLGLGCGTTCVKDDGTNCVEGGGTYCRARCATPCFFCGVYYVM